MNKYRIMLEEWKEMISKENIINRLNAGETLKSLQIELIDKYKLNIQDKYSGRALGKALERCEYIKENNMYYSKEDYIFKNGIAFLDMEEMIEEITDKRYYEYYTGYYWSDYNPISIGIDEKIIGDIKVIADKLGIDNFEDYISLVLLEHLEEIDPKDLRRDFKLKQIQESKYWSDEEVEFVLQKEDEGYDLRDVCFYIEEGIVDLNMTKEEFAKAYKD